MMMMTLATMTKGATMIPNCDDSFAVVDSLVNDTVWVSSLMTTMMILYEVTMTTAPKPTLLY